MSIPKTTPHLKYTEPLTGLAAIEIAERRGTTLNAYATPSEDHAEGLSVEQAREIAAADPSRVYLPYPRGVIDMAAESNDPEQAGTKASYTIRFGMWGRYRVFAAHTRGDAVEWMVTDAEAADPVTGGPGVIRQASTLADAVAGL